MAALQPHQKDFQFFKFCLYGFLKNLRFYDAFLLLFFLENDISFSQIGILYAVREIVTNISEIPSGIIADTYGRKKSLVGAFLLYITSFIVFYYSVNFGLLLLAMALVGVGDAFRSGTHKGMIMDYLQMNGWQSEKVAYYGSTRSWSQVGSALSAIIAGLMVFYSGGYRTIYLLSTIPYIANLINIASYPESLNHQKNKEATIVFSPQQVVRNLIDYLKQKKVLKIINSSALHSSFLSSVKDYIQPLIVNLAILLPVLEGVDTKRKSGLIIGIVYFLIFLMTAQASKNAFRLSGLNIPRIDLKTLLLGLLVGGTSGLLFHFEYWPLALIFFIFIYVIENLRKPILTGLLADNVPVSILTSVISAQSFYQTIITASLAIGIGLMADHFGIGTALFSAAIVLGLLTIIIEAKPKS